MLFRSVLFLDRMYPDPCPASRKEAIQKMALSLAKRLDLPLLTQDPEGSSPYPGTIQSLGSNCPYEYVDAGEGVMKEGVFVINNVRQIL